MCHKEESRDLLNLAIASGKNVRDVELVQAEGATKPLMYELFQFGALVQSSRSPYLGSYVVIYLAHGCAIPKKAHESDWRINP